MGSSEAFLLDNNDGIVNPNEPPPEEVLQTSKPHLPGDIIASIDRIDVLSECTTPCTPATPMTPATPANEEFGVCLPPGALNASADTLLIFDWDDTLCPSFWIRHHGMTLQDPFVDECFRVQLNSLAIVVQEVLDLALSLGEVIIITNAEHGWIDRSVEQWMPTLSDTVRKFTRISARSVWEPKGVTSPCSWKSNQFHESILHFKDNRLNKFDAKSVISIGDSPHEREALNRVGNTAAADCTIKSVQLLLRPTLEMLKHQLITLKHALPKVVKWKETLDLRFNNNVPVPMGPMGGM